MTAKRLAAQYNQSSLVRSEIQVLQVRLSQSVAALKQDVVTGPEALKTLKPMLLV
jgi:hypothetical protein